MSATAPSLLQRARQAYARGDLLEARRLARSILASANSAAALHLIALVEHRLGNHALADRTFAQAAELSGASEQLYLDWCELHSGSGNFEAAETVLRKGVSRFPTSKTLLQRYGDLKREAGARDEATLIFDHMLRNWPTDSEILASRALVELERGADARAHYREALKRSPRSRPLLLGLAAAEAAAGETDAAIATLEREAGRGEIWPEGLRTLARLRWGRGDGPGFTADCERALRKQPRSLPGWATYIGVLASGLHFDLALEVIPRARAALGDHPLLDMLEAQALAETGQAESAELLFRKLEPITDPTFVPTRMRALLRTGRPVEAARLGESFTATIGAAHVWPLLSLAWRATGDTRWQWLERPEEAVAVIDAGLSDAELEELADLLRRLHADSAHPYDQSARGGTQTSGNLFSRTDRAINRLQRAASEAVSAFIARLPPVDPAHPFLGRSRSGFRFSGSWSIRLLDEGYHLSHVHPEGWISSAFYVSIPSSGSGAGEDPQAGWLELGASPPELGLGFPPLRLIEPKAGRLVLFPSIMWHGTVPFPAGERLTAAFDVVPYGLSRQGTR